jgi:hypothetical protein
MSSNKATVSDIRSYCYLVYTEGDECIKDFLVKKNNIRQVNTFCKDGVNCDVNVEE